MSQQSESLDAEAQPTDELHGPSQMGDQSPHLSDERAEPNEGSASLSSSQQPSLGSGRKRNGHRLSLCLSPYISPSRRESYFIAAQECCMVLTAFMMTTFNYSSTVSYTHLTLPTILLV